MADLLDSFGCLARCTNCEKTGKTCTFQWLREQRIAQATPPLSTGRPAKKRRSQRSLSQSRCGTVQRPQGQEAPQADLSDTTSGTTLVPQHESNEPGPIFSDFSGVTPTFDFKPSLSPPTSLHVLAFSDIATEQANEVTYPANALKTTQEAVLETESGNGSDIYENGVMVCRDTGSSNSSNGDSTVVRIPRKRRRRRSSSTLPASEMPCPILCLAASDLASSANNALLADGLLRIYHDSFENHLSCWLTERTCPYVSDSDVSLPGDIGPDWNRMYYRVFKLDRASSVRGRSLSAREDRAASKAVNLSILSYATQAHSNRDSTSKYPFRSNAPDSRNGTSASRQQGRSFDQALRISTWHQARMALKDAAEIESFRVVLALLVFSLTQKPLDGYEEEVQEQSLSEHSVRVSPDAKEDLGSTSSVISTQTDDQGIDECEDLLSKLNLAIDNDGPSIYLEQGLRLVHSLRCRMTMRGAFCGRPKKMPRSWRRSRPASSCLEPDDRATVDLLFWLGIMFDTLSSAMHKRPLVVSLEDSDLPAVRDIPGEVIPKGPTAPAEDLWDEHLYSRQRGSRQCRTVRWPCSYEDAASLLCSAAPVKVLLFRKVTRLQTLLSRRVQGGQMEKAIQRSLELCDHWRKLYAQFIQDCIENHDQLPAHVKSWYICVASHWHLATLLLADLIEIIDDSELSGELQREDRISSRFIWNFKLLNCSVLSDIARCACPREDYGMPGSQSLHFAMTREAILTEPWMIVLVRAFAMAGVLLLDFATTFEGSNISQEEAVFRVGHCVRALQYLGQRSDAAFDAADILGEALRKTQDKAEGAVEGTVRRVAK